MHAQLFTAILGCLLLGQLPAASGSAASGWSNLGQQAPTKAEAPPRSTARDIVADALSLPAETPLSGRAVPLVAALSAAADARQQLEIARAYWRLIEAVSVYHFCFNYDAQVQRLQAQAEETALLRTAQVSSSALLREAETAAVAAQHDLAALVRLPIESPLPLPLDRPHVGPYQTRFNELFAARAVPVQARLIDRTLPIRRQAIDSRAAAVQAAEEALKATLAARGAGRASFSDVLECLRDGLHQRQALIASVCRYNCDIAEYVLMTVGPAASAQVLVTMLIENPHSAAAPAAAIVDPAVQPTGLNQQVPTPARRPGKNVPTRASRDTRPPSPPSSPSPPPSSSPTSPPSSSSPPSDEPTLLPTETEQPKAMLPKQPVVPVDPTPSDPTPTTVNKPGIAELLPPKEMNPSNKKGTGSEPIRDSSGITDRREVPVPFLLDASSPSAVGGAPAKAAAETAAVVGTPPMYPALLHASPAARAKELTAALHWDRTLPPGTGQPIGLEECLRGRTGAERQAVIDAFWQLRQRAAEYQVLIEQGEWLDELGLKTLEGAEPAARLRSARSANQAARQEAQIALVEAQAELAGRIGRASAAIWPLAAAVPRCGAYAFKADAQSRQTAPSWPLRRLAALIPGLSDTLERQATAVVEADAARAAAATSYLSAGGAIEPALAAIRGQTAQTMALLRTLTDYNRAIAEYVLTVLPPDTPGDKLVGQMTNVE